MIDVSNFLQLLEEQKRRVVKQMQQEAWDEARLAGIDVATVAEAAIETAFKHLLAEFGEENALAILERTRDQIVAGEFIRPAFNH